MQRDKVGNTCWTIETPHLGLGSNLPYNSKILLNYDRVFPLLSERVPEKK